MKSEDFKLYLYYHSANQKRGKRTDQFEKSFEIG